MQDYKNDVPFDPGFAPYVENFSANIEAIYTEIARQKSHNQKKFTFKRFLPIIQNLIKNQASFYLGCLLWAGFCRYRFNESKEFIGNSFLNLSQEELEKYDFSAEINFFIDYIEKFTGETAYYLGKPIKLEPIIFEIAQNYKIFLEINNNFIETRVTADIKLPEKLDYFKNLSKDSLDEIEEKIYNAIQHKNIEMLLTSGFYGC
ncbi:MAG: hypothetical protein PHV68_04315 [Candidatus Gastranaerophilales bacterium]|nr:hypothetical protein [Candidatus Gastranaerophilales bacterium]